VWYRYVECNLHEHYTTRRSHIRSNALDLLSFKNGYGPFGKNGLKIVNYKIEMLYQTPTAGLGLVVCYPLNSLKKGETC
jgi:hypothetical protein